MGTFHDNLGDLHGVTIAVLTHDNRALVGRCHEANDQKVIMLEVDEHRDGEGGLSIDAYLQRAARWGVFAKQNHVILRREDIASITPLGQISASAD